MSSKLPLSIHKTGSTGFTLVEMLVYLAILIVVMVASVTTMLSLNGILTQYRLETELYRNGTAALEQIVLSLRQAEEFDMINSVTYPSATSSLVVTGGPATAQFERVDNQLLLSLDGESYGTMTDEAVSVIGFTVYHYNTVVGDFVRVELELEAAFGDMTRSETFYGGSVLRGAF